MQPIMLKNNLRLKLSVQEEDEFRLGIPVQLQVMRSICTINENARLCNRSSDDGAVNRTTHLLGIILPHPTTPVP